MFKTESKIWRVSEGNYEKTYDTYRETLPLKIIAMNRELYVSGLVSGSMSGKSHIDGSVGGGYGGQLGVGVMAGTTHGSGQMSGSLSGSQNTTYLYTATLRDEASGRCYDMFISTDDYHNFKIGDTVYVSEIYRQFNESYSKEKVAKLRARHAEVVAERHKKWLAYVEEERQKADRIQARQLASLEKKKKQKKIFWLVMAGIAATAINIVGVVHLVLSCKPIETWRTDFYLTDQNSLFTVSVNNSPKLKIDSRNVDGPISLYVSYGGFDKPGLVIATWKSDSTKYAWNNGSGLYDSITAGYKTFTTNTYLSTLAIFSKEEKYIPGTFNDTNGFTYPYSPDSTYCRRIKFTHYKKFKTDKDFCNSIYTDWFAADDE